MTGLYVVLGALVVALAFGGYRRVTDGRARAVDVRGGGVRAADGSEDEPRLTASALGDSLGADATVVQFSSTTCAPCRTTHRLLAELLAHDPGVSHLEINAEDRLDLVQQFGITRTPTVLLLDRRGVVRHKIVGVPRKPDLVDALGAVSGRVVA